VANDQIISGHEYVKGQYVIIDPEELDRLRTPADKMIGIDAFVSPDTIDPIYLSGKVYYLVPDAKAGDHPFALPRAGRGQGRRKGTRGAPGPGARPGLEPDGRAQGQRCHASWEQAYRGTATEDDGAQHAGAEGGEEVQAEEFVTDVQPSAN
jgi:Ku70/Ku80 beta-barrel domain